MTFQRENLLEAFKDSVGMLIRHWQEVTPHKTFELEPDFNTYLVSEAEGCLRVYTARDPDRVLCGYAVFIVRSNRHHKSKTFAYQDAVYVDANKRGFGHTFMKWCDEQLKADGVDVVFHYVTRRFDFSPILERHGYREIERVWAKTLTED